MITIRSSGLIGYEYHSRYYRLWSNDKFAEPQFEKSNDWEVTKLGTPYDYDSVMHYEADAFSRNGRPTIVRLDRKELKAQRDGFSDIDIIEINRLYNCPNNRRPTTIRRPTRFSRTW